jgi:hypothetical protein
MAAIHPHGAQHLVKGQILIADTVYPVDGLPVALQRFVMAAHRHAGRLALGNFKQRQIIWSRKPRTSQQQRTKRRSDD